MRIVNDSGSGKEGQISKDLCGGHCGKLMNWMWREIE